MAHHCVSNPCWICYPKYAPEPASYFEAPPPELSPYLKELLIKVFSHGLNKNNRYTMPDSLDLLQIKAERANIASDSLEAKLIDLMIEDFESEE